jgi:hypothetical protein
MQSTASEIPNKIRMRILALRKRGSFSGGTVVDITLMSSRPRSRSIAMKMVQPTFRG